MDFSAVILAGGRSSRMGSDKAWLEVGGRPLLARQIELVRAAGARQVFISGRVGVNYSAFGCPVLLDAFADAGPLAGLERGLQASPSEFVFALAVDMPAMSPALLTRLASACLEGRGVIPRVAGAVEPLAGFYPKASHPLLTAVLRDRATAEAGGRGPLARGFAELCVAAGLANYLDFHAQDAGCFTNWNSPADLQEPAPSRPGGPQLTPG